MSQSTRNGVNVDDLMTAIEAVKTDPANGKLTFTVSSKWTGGFKANHSTSATSSERKRESAPSSHSISTDEPNEVLGSDTGISPAETLISSLAACLAVGYAANAAALGIDLDELSFRDHGQRKPGRLHEHRRQATGFERLEHQDIRQVQCTAEKLQELHDLVNDHSPIWDTICNPVKIESKIVKR